MMKLNKIVAMIIAVVLVLSMAGCTTIEKGNTESVATQTVSTVTNNDSSEKAEENVSGTVEEDNEAVEAFDQLFEGSILDTTDMFTNRDLEQEADLSEATYIDLEDNDDVMIESEGIYLVKGEAVNSTIIVEADDEAKVQIVLDGVNVVNEDTPVIYVKSADKVFVTTTDSMNTMEVSGDYEADGDTNLDAVIFSRDDLVLNGLGTLEVVSYEGNGIASKDDLKITGGVINIAAKEDALEANDSIRVYDGEIVIVADKDGLHSENEEDDSLGYIYIAGGSFNISSSDDAIHANSVIQIDGGDITIDTSAEGIEATYVQINEGTITLYATDDGINAASKSSAYDVVIEVNGGNITVTMASGDTDGFDANGDMTINGGFIDITGGSYIDADGSVEFNGGELIVNGEVVTEITQQMGGGRGKGGR